MASRLTPHVRHRHKYTDVPVAARAAFVFTCHGTRVGRAARTLNEFSARLGALPVDVLGAHLARHDFSRWIANVYRDRALAAQVDDLEKEHETGAAPGTGAAAALAISDRYFLVDEIAFECPPAVVSISA